MIRTATAAVLAAVLVLFTAGATAVKPPAHSGAISQSTAPGAVQGAEQADSSATSAPRLQTLFYNKETYTKAVYSPQKYEGGGVLRAAMLPHHLVAADMLSGVYSLAAQSAEEYDTVIVLSPSHFPQNCGSDIVTSSLGWSTPYGNVDADTGLTDALLKNTLLAAEDNPKAVEQDHGVSVHIPFIRHYLPNARVAVCLVGNKLPRESLAELWAFFSEYCKNNKVLFLASTDCSHYLMPREAEQRDAETEAAIEQGNTEKLLSFTDSNSDSPQAVTTFLAVAAGQGLAPKQLGHASSTDYLPHSIESSVYAGGITTYFVYGAFA